MLGFQEKEDLNPSGYVDYTCHNILSNITPGKHNQDF